MPHPAIEPLKILERRKSVQDLWLRGTSQWEIARDLKVSRRTVCRDLDAIMALGLERVGAKRETWVWEEVAKLNRWESEANDAWERSKKDAEVRVAKRVETAGGERTEASRREEGQCGDPRYLAEARGCARQRCDLLGLLVQKHEHAGKDGKDLLQGWNQATTLALVAFVGKQEAAAKAAVPQPATSEKQP